VEGGIAKSNAEQGCSSEIVTALNMLRSQFKEDDLQQLINTFKELREHLKSQKTKRNELPRRH